MTREIVEILEKLRKKPASNSVDHISLLNRLYGEYSEGLTELQPIMNYYLNGLDDLPILKERELWNKDKFEEIRKPFTDSHSELVTIINSLLAEQNLPIKLWVDFNASCDSGVRLNCRGTIADLKSQNIELKEGMKLQLWDEDYNDNNERDDLTVDAIARYNKETGIWEGEFEWDDIKNQSEREK